MPARKTLPKTGELYQLVNRGFCKMNIFREEADYLYFKGLVGTYSGGVDIEAYALVPNHFHFLVKQIKGDGIASFAARLSMVYSRHFNRKYRRKGTLYEGRYCLDRIRDDRHYQNVVNYILNNPAKHKLIKLGRDGVSGLKRP